MAEPGPTEPTPEQLAEQIKRLKVSELLVSNVPLIAQLGYAKLEAGTLDLAEARLAIEALRALAGVLEGSVEPDVSRGYAQLIANLQLAYADAAARAGGEEKPTGTEKAGDDG